MKYTLKDDEIHIILEQGDRWTDQTLSPSPTVVSAGTVWAREVLKPLLVDLLPVVEVVSQTPMCQRTGKPLPYDIHMHWSDVEAAIDVLPHLIKMIKELSQ